MQEERYFVYTSLIAGVETACSLEDSSLDREETIEGLERRGL